METYNPKDVKVIVDGTIITGFAENTFVQAAKDEDNWTPYVGAQGEVARALNANSMGRITITLKSTSPSNAVLNNLSKKQNTFPARVVDRNTGQTTAGGSECWVQKAADLQWAGEITERQWVIVVADYDQNIR